MSVASWLGVNMIVFGNLIYIILPRQIQLNPKMAPKLDTNMRIQQRKRSNIRITATGY